jgi:hypothetical protein
MPTTQQLETRLGRVKKQVAGIKEAAAQRQLHKTQRRLQRKLRARRPAPAPAAKPSGGTAPAPSPPAPPSGT